MRYCDRCKVEVLDNTEYCPLCHSVLQVEGEDNSFDFFPDVYKKKKISSIVASMFLFATFVSLIMGIYFDYVLNMNASVLFLVTAAFFYATIIMEFITRETGYLIQMFTYTIGGVALVLLLDLYTGFYGWSVDYVLPGTIILVNIVLLILMAVNSRNWQGYMASQLIMIIIGLIPVVLINIGIVKNPIVSEIAFLSSLIVFLGTLILGGRTAREELKRRFHI
jgi:hypothetical protein